MTKTLVTAAAIIALFNSFHFAHATGRLPIMQLVADKHEAQLKVMVTRGKHYQYLLTYANKVILPTSITAFSWGNSPHIIHHLSFSGLQAQREYTLQVRVQKKIIDSRKLRPASLATANSIRFAIASCMYDIYEEQKSIWSALLAQKPQLILLVGDNVYADKEIKGHGIVRNHGGQTKTQMVATPAELWRRYAETRAKLAIFQSKYLVPVHAVWDDHDYGMNNGDRSYPFKQAAKRIFKAFFHGHETHNVHMSGLGVGSYITLGDYSFFMLDNRFFRSPNLAANTSPSQAIKNEAHFGDKQLAWLMNHLHDKRHAFVVAGDQWFADYHRFESFANNHPNRFKHFIAKLKTIPTKLLFFSGDRHLSEIMELPAKQYLGYKTYEFTSSPIHAKVYPSNWDTIPNSLQKRGVAEQHNFLLLDATITADELTTETKSINRKGRVLFTHKGLVRL